MPFKFTLLGLEVSSGKNKCEKVKMTKLKGKTKQRKQQKKFGKAVKKCHRITKTPHTFGSCMKKELKK